MADYTTLIKGKFPVDERNGLFLSPNLPAVKLGRILRRDKRINSPSDVLAMHTYSGTFSSGVLLFTRDACYYPKGSFLLEDVKEFQHKGDDCTVFVNQKGQFVPHEFSVKNEQVARSLGKVFDAIRYNDPVAEAMVKNTYEGFSHTELDWLKLRDEIMKTIDLLYDRYNDGKLTLMEYENKKEELLSRL